MSKPKILLQFDTDPLPSSFDAVVAVDAGVEHLISYGGVAPAGVVPLVHGAMYTRGPNDLSSTAIFVGGSDVEKGEAVLRAVKQAFSGPFRVSVVFDANGANTTAVAAVAAMARHRDLSETTTLILGSTGPVGSRAARLLVQGGSSVYAASRKLDRAEKLGQSIRDQVPHARLEAIQQPASGSAMRERLAEVDVVLAAGAAGVELLAEADWRAVDRPQVLIDLNALPPAGIGGVETFSRAVHQGKAIVYGAIGVGGDKMKLQKAVLRKLFERNDQIWDVEEILALATEMGLTSPE